MARPTKQGLSYFPLDTNFDEKTELFVIENGADGLGILITVWQLIYDNEGYYIHNGNDLYLLVKKRVFADINRIKDVINNAINRGIFDSKVHKKFKILTSKAIQKRYFEAARKKKIVQYNVNYIINGVNVSDNSINVGNNATKEKEDVNVKEKEEVYEGLLSTWNYFADHYELSKLLKLTDSRKSHLNQRLKENDFDLLAILKKAETQSFLFGDNDRNWKMDFDWLIKNNTNYMKILEGKYGKSNGSNTDLRAKKIYDKVASGEW